ncbi:hypothetical protein AHAS_Ahas04G0156000 [Arachis hypogaea]
MDGTSKNNRKIRNEVIEYESPLDLQPYDIWVKIAMKVASNSVQELFQIKATRKVFLDAASFDAVYKHATMWYLPQGDFSYFFDQCPIGGVMSIVEDSSNVLCLHCLADYEDVPKVGMYFGTIEDANQFYQNYAKRVGFVTKIRFTRRVGKDKVPKNQMITCNREGKRKSRVSPIEKTNPRTNYNCPARISIRLNKEGLWIISKVCLDHSHPCDPEMAKLLTRNREMTMHMCRVIERNDEAGVRPSKTYQVLVGEAGGFSKINLMEKDVRNYLSRKADARSRAAYEYFGDIVSFDTTYKTNRYDMPFGSFVGVNHHGNSVLLGCGLLTKENSGSFTWLFNAWLTCMHGKAPKGIITDQCLGIRAGIENVMPETRHRLCIWYIT